MGLFSLLKESFDEANDDAHGARLLAQVKDCFIKMEALDKSVQLYAMAGYVEIRERLKDEMPNLSREGRIKVGRTMQKQAGPEFDLDMGGSYAKFLAGAWLESKERQSLQAAQACTLLDGFDEYVRATIGDAL